MNLVDSIPVWGEPVDEGALRQIKTCAQSARKVALMADHHKGYAVPIGGVVAYRDKISPSGVGFDIGCGNMAVQLNTPATKVSQNIRTIMDDVWNTVSFGIGRKNEDASVKYAVERFMAETAEMPGWDVGICRGLRDLAANQLGTVGSGNHFVDIFEDLRDGSTWIGVHFGSRGFGHKIAAHFLNRAGAKDGMDVEPCVLSAESVIGQEYIAAMALAGKYAYAGREWVVERVRQIIGGNVLQSVHNHHNFAWLEEHGGEMLWVVRKGATPAFPGQKGFIGSTMTGISYIVEGVETDLAAHSLYSTVHGAGRVMGRMEAKGKWKNGVCVREPKVDAQKWQRELQTAGVELRGGGLDEAPDCYKQLDNVLAHHEGTIKILHHLKPMGVAMAGKDEIDPYKD